MTNFLFWLQTFRIRLNVDVEDEQDHEKVWFNLFCVEETECHKFLKVMTNGTSQLLVNSTNLQPP